MWGFSKEEKRTLLLNSFAKHLLTIKRRLEAVKDVESMTKQECCASLDEWKETWDLLLIHRRHMKMVFFDNDEFEKPWDSLRFLAGHLKLIFEDIDKLIDLLDVKKKTFGLVPVGKFGMNVQALVSGFKYVAKDYNVKDHTKVQVDLQSLAGDPTLRKDVIDRLFDDDISNVKTPFDYSIMKQESASKPDDQPVIEVISDDQNYDAPKQADV